VALNFDAQINVDVSKFLASVGQAEAAVTRLQTKLANINAISPRITVGSGASSDMADRRSRSNEAIRAMAQEEAMARAMGQTERNNAKVEFQAEQMRKKAMDARLKDHETLSSAIDRQISQEQRQRTSASNSIKQQMQDREQMNKIHAQANAMNQKFDTARENAANATIRNSARERYALYDVAAAYAALSYAGLQAFQQLTGAAISYERSFANVIRTTEFTGGAVGAAARVMRYELMQIASEIPLAFGKITDIATIGNQLGIAQGELSSFTQTVAKFSATTGMTADATAMGLGRTIELLSDEKTKVSYEALGSAIAYAGVKAVATEEQILSVTKEISTTAKLAKFAAPDVVGLATALSSVGVAPEAARGSIIRTFAAINKAISENGPQLEAYAKISGMTAGSFAQAWKEDGQVAFDAFLNGLQSLSNGGANLDTVLRNIGFRNVRDIQTVQKLGDNYNVYAEAIQNSNKAYEEGTYLNKSYSVIQETVASKLELMSNNWNNFMATLGEETFGDSLKSFIDYINSALKQLTELARSPIGEFLGKIIGTISILAIVLGTVNGVIALSKAAMLAFSLAASALVPAIGAARGSLAIFDAQMAKLALTAKLSEGALARARVGFVALNNVLKAGLITAGLAAVFELVNAIGNAMKSATTRAEELTGGFGGLQEAVTADTKSLKDTADQLGISTQHYIAMSDAVTLQTSSVKSNDQATRDAAAAHDAMLYITGQEPAALDAASGQIDKQTLILGKNTTAWLKNAIATSSAGLFRNKTAVSALQQTNFSLDEAILAKEAGKLDVYFNKIENKAKGINFFDFVAQQEIGNLESIIGGTVDQIKLLGLATDGVSGSIDRSGDSTDEFGDSLEKTAKIIRTVTDYAGDLSNVFTRIKNINFGSSVAYDDITSGWSAISDSAEDAQKNIDKANASIKELTADKSVLQYQLSVAERYGDEKRAAVIRAKLAKLDNQMADETKNLSDAQEASNKTLTGNSKAAIANRAALTGMVDKYQAYIVSLVESGLKGKDLADAIAEANTEFADQAKKAGFAESELVGYTKTVTQFGIAASKIPSGVTVTFKSDTDAATQAIKEYMAKANAANKTVTTNFNANVNGAEKVAILARILALQTQIEIGSEQLKKDNLNAEGRRNLGAGMSSAGREIAQLQASLRNMAAGGYVSGPGSSTSDSIPARLSNGEFVMNAAAVRTYGVDFMNSLNNQQTVRPSFAGSSATTQSAGSSIVYLSPDDRALLRAAIDRPVNLFADSTKIASSANTGNVLLAQRGLN